jgi:undecaprenyl-diphosphatase
MILLEQLVKLDASKDFLSMFLVVIQFGAILAVVLLFWDRLFPFSIKEKPHMKKDILAMWLKILFSCVPAAVVGLLFEEQLDTWFYNYRTVAIMLILFGIAFILVEKNRKSETARATAIDEITWQDAFWIGMFQLIAAVFPGTSRSGATILGGILLGLARTTAAEYTFFLAVPVMFGASLLKILKFGSSFSGSEVRILFVGMVTAFATSVLVIRFLLGYLRKHDFTVFGWYRILLGILVLVKL